jgi:DnaJ-domain-containing protein 1
MRGFAWKQRWPSHYHTQTRLEELLFRSLSETQNRKKRKVNIAFNQALHTQVTYSSVAGQLRTFTTVRIDYYAVLGVEKTARQDTIKKKYFELARECHPDRRPGDEDASRQFYAIAEAYEVCVCMVEKPAPPAIINCFVVAHSFRL